MDCEKVIEKLRTNAVTLLSCVWHGIDWDNVSSRRRMKIYEEFAAKIKSASATGTLSHFLEKLCQKMDANISGADAPKILEIIRSTEKEDLDLEILDVLRSETEYLVLSMREQNQELKEGSKQTTLGV